MTRSLERIVWQVRDGFSLWNGAAEDWSFAALGYPANPVRQFRVGVGGIHGGSPRHNGVGSSLNLGVAGSGSQHLQTKFFSGLRLVAGGPQVGQDDRGKLLKAGTAAAPRTRGNRR